jgi:hypothetical protein
MGLLNIAPGDAVAILPSCASAPAETIEISWVVYVNFQIVRLIDHRMYSRYDGMGLTPGSRGYLRLATAAHRHAVGLETDAVVG